MRQRLQALWLELKERVSYVFQFEEIRRRQQNLSRDVMRAYRALENYHDAQMRLFAENSNGKCEKHLAVTKSYLPCPHPDCFHMANRYLRVARRPKMNSILQGIEHPSSYSLPTEEMYVRGMIYLAGEHIYCWVPA